MILSIQYSFGLLIAGTLTSVAELLVMMFPTPTTMFNSPILLWGITTCLLLPGCATRKYGPYAPYRAQVEQMSHLAAQHTESIHQVKSDVRNLDARAESGVNFAAERTSTAYGHALIADEDASLALNTATRAQEASSRETAELEALARAVSALDDFQLQSSVAVLFDVNSDVLSAAVREQLDRLAESLKSTPKFLLEIYGYTDSSETERYNDELSWRRADSVAHYLIVKHAIPAYLIQYIGLGNQKPVDQGHTQEARAKNRRAVVKVYIASGPPELNALTK